MRSRPPSTSSSDDPLPLWGRAGWGRVRHQVRRDALPGAGVRVQNLGDSDKPGLLVRSLRSKIVAGDDQRHAYSSALLDEIARDERHGLRAEAAVEVIAFADENVDTPISSW